MFEPEAAYDEDVASLNDDSAEGEPVMSVIDGNKPGSDDGDDGDDTPPSPPRGGRPALRVVK